MTNNKINYGSKLNLSIISLAILLTFSGCDNEKSSVITPGEKNLWEYINSSATHTVLAQLIEGTSIQSTLSGMSAYTFLAPTDAAFASLPEGTFEGLTTTQKTGILRYHLMHGLIQIGTEPVNENRKSVHGDFLFLTIHPAGNRVNNSALITEKNISVSNGIIHSVDNVLFPDIYGTVLDNLKKRYTFTPLVDQMGAIGLHELLEEEGHISLMVPPPVIFSDIETWLGRSLTAEQQEEIWKYNMIRQNLGGYISGTKTALQTVMGDSVYLVINHPGQYLFNIHHSTTTDPTQKIVSSNGVIYQMDGLLTPDRYNGILTLMDKRYYLSTVRIGFAKAKMTGRMYNALANSDEEFTVFIPKNDSQGLENLPEDEEGLADILKYHVLLEKVTADQLQHNQVYTTWQGEEITITRNGDLITINGTATIKLADLEGTNGVVHVIDAKLELP